VEEGSGKWDGSMGVGVGGGGESEGVQRLRQRWADRRSGAVPLRSAWRPLGVNSPAAPLTAILFEVCRHLLFIHFTHKPRMHHSNDQTDLPTRFLTLQGKTSLSFALSSLSLSLYLAPKQLCYLFLSHICKNMQLITIILRSSNNSQIVAFENFRFDQTNRNCINVDFVATCYR